MSRDMTFPFTEDQLKWIEELKTTTKKQGQCMLRSIDDAFCCLGIACELFIPETVSSFASGYKYGEYSNYSFLPRALSIRLHLRDGSGGFDVPEGDKQSLADLNDSECWSFIQIAEYIETNPRNVFTNGGEPADGSL